MTAHPRREDYERIRVLIWGKTYPELSAAHTETVCTAGCRENGDPIRLYPVPLRYLNGAQQYRLYDIVEVDVQRNLKDPRPESHRIAPDTIQVVSHLDSDRFEWGERRAWTARSIAWHFDSVADLRAAQETRGLSLGLVRPGTIIGARLVQKSPSARNEYFAKWDELTAGEQGDLFPREYKSLDFIPVEIRLQWRCAGACTCHDGAPHDMQVLDWGLVELGRKTGKWELARDRLAEISDLSRYDFRLFMGTFRLHMTTFGVIGLWYPKRAEQGVLL